MKNYIKSLTASQLITGIYLILVLIGLPLTIHNAYYDISTTKYYFYCGVSILLVPVLFLNLKNPFSLQGFYKTLSTGEKALIIYWIVSALSTVFSPYRFEAFWGNEGRLCGLMLMSIYVISYFIVTRCCKPHPIFIYACIFAGTIVFLLGITDFFNLDIFHFKARVSHQDSVNFISTLGNINFYAGYGAVIVGMIVGIYATYTKWKGTIVYFFLMLIGFIGLIIGNSDNAYLTFGVLIAFLPLCLFRDRQGIRRYFMVISTLLFAFLFVKILTIHFSGIVWELNGIPAMILRWDSFIYVCIVFWIITLVLYGIDYRLRSSTESLGKGLQTLWGIFLGIAALAVIAVLVDANLLGHGDRYSAIGNYVIFNNDWGTHRGFVWRKAIENYQNFPLLQKILGLGPDTYGIILYFKDLGESGSLYGELFDNVHNEYLQFFVTIGPIATGAYIIFLGCSIWDMFRYSCSPYVIGAAFGVFCYCGQALVSINQPASTPIMWTVLAIGIAECRYTALHKQGKRQG